MKKNQRNLKNRTNESELHQFTSAPFDISSITLLKFSSFTAVNKSLFMPSVSICCISFVVKVGKICEKINGNSKAPSINLYELEKLPRSKIQFFVFENGDGKCNDRNVQLKNKSSRILLESF